MGTSALYRFITAAATAMLAAVQPSIAAGESQRTIAVKQSLRQHLRDPQSAQFRNVRQYADGTVCGELNAKNGFGGYVGFRSFVVRPGTLAGAWGDDWLWCSNKANKLQIQALLEAEDTLRSRISSCVHAKTEADEACREARASAKEVKRLGGKPPPIPEPFAVTWRKTEQSHELWAGMCEGSGEKATCDRASQLEGQIRAMGFVPKSREAIRKEKLESARSAHRLAAAKCEAEDSNAEAPSCKAANEAAIKVKALTPAGSEEAE